MIRVALALLVMTGVAHADMDALDVLQRVEQTYKKPATLTATFEQTVTNALTGKPTRSRGAIFVAKPDKIRFEYLKTKAGKTTIDTLQVFDGKTGWYIDHGGLQYAKLDTTTSSLPAVATFFLGANTLSKEFEPAFGATRTGPEIVLELTPKKPSAAYAKITLTVDTKGYRVSKVTITSSSGTTQELAFANVVTDKPIDAKTFVIDKKAIADYREVKR